MRTANCLRYFYQKRDWYFFLYILLKVLDPANFQGPRGHNGTQGNVGQARPPGPAGPPGPAMSIDFSKCRIKIKVTDNVKKDPRTKVIIRDTKVSVIPEYFSFLLFEDKIRHFWIEEGTGAEWPHVG